MPQLSRKEIIKPLAWSVPVMGMALAAPGAAASVTITPVIPSGGTTYSNNPVCFDLSDSSGGGTLSFVFTGTAVTVSPQFVNVVPGTDRYCTVINSSSLSPDTAVGSVTYQPSSGSSTRIPYALNVLSSGISLGVFNATSPLNSNGFLAHSFNVPARQDDFQSGTLTVGTPYRFVFQALNGDSSYRYSMSGVTFTLVSSNVPTSPALPSTFVTTNAGFDEQTPFAFQFTAPGTYNVTYTDGNRASTLTLKVV